MAEPEHIDRRRATLIAYDVCRAWQLPPDQTQLLKLVGTCRAGASVHSGAIERLSSALDRMSIVD